MSFIFCTDIDMSPMEVELTPEERAEAEQMIRDMKK